MFFNKELLVSLAFYTNAYYTEGYVKFMSRNLNSIEPQSIYHFLYS